MDVAMEEVLRTIGWNTGFRLPVANDENQALEREMALLIIKKGNRAKEFDDTTQRYNNLDVHLKYVQQEVKQNQTLLSAYKQQYQNEDNKFKLSMAERDNTNHEVRRMRKTIDDIEDRQCVKRTDLARSIQKLEKIKAEVSWDSEAMRAWEESLKKRDEDNELLKRFSVEDQRKMHEMEAKRASLRVDFTEKRDILEKMSQEIVSYEQNVSRIGKIMKQMNDERKALVRQWQEAVRNLRQRDQDIKRANGDILALQDVLKIKRDQLSEQNEFLNNEKRSNRLLEMEIEEHNLQNSRIRLQLKEAMENVALLNNEVQIKKKEVEATAYDLQKEQMKYKAMRTEISEREISIWTLARDVELLTHRLEEAKKKTLSASERSKQIEEMMNATKKQTADLEISLESIQAAFYRNSKALSEAKEFATLKRAQIKGAETTLAGIGKRYKKESRELVYQKQILSDLEMKVACILAKLGNIEGENDMEDDVQQWQLKIKELEDILAEHTEIKNMLQTQNLILQKESVRLITAISSDTERVQYLKDKLQSLLVMYEGGIKQVAALKLKSQQRQVAENVLKLKVDKLSKAMNKAEKEIYDLQKYRIDLETVMKERHIEIQTAREILLAKRRNLDEEKGRLKADISVRNVKINQLQNKYELAVGNLGKDENGEPLSVAHFKIKAAQEKYLLQQEGDDLDKRVRRAETEIVAMENTLKVVNSTNISFRKSLETVDDEGYESLQFKELESAMKDKMLVVAEKKKYYLDKQGIFKEMHKKLKYAEDVRNEIKTELYGKVDVCTKLEREENDRLEKIDRAQKQICHCKKNIDPQSKQKYDKEIFIRQLQDTNKNIQYQIADFSYQNIEVTPKVVKYFTNYGLEVPTVRTTISSISSDSIRTPSSAKSVCNVTSLELTFGEESPPPKKEPKKVVKRKCKKYA